ncbi:hypothetical protein L4C36_21345 [Photobacterium japonica]|uniref:hypothetical protein n=1 Tax=Photobacterium japonica TaxID=2910235 RepID=UPI003D0C65FB
MSNKKKPTGITVIAVYSGFGGILSTMGGGGLLVLSSSMHGFPPWILAMAVVSVILGIGLLASVFGFLTLKRWGWSLTNGLYGLSIPMGAASIFPIFPGSEMTVGNTIMQCISIALAVFILVYIRKPHVKPLFV